MIWDTTNHRIIIFLWNMCRWHSKRTRCMISQSPSSRWRAICRSFKEDGAPWEASASWTASCWQFPCGFSCQSTLPLHCTFCRGNLPGSEIYLYSYDTHAQFPLCHLICLTSSNQLCCPAVVPGEKVPHFPEKCALCSFGGWERAIICAGVWHQKGTIQ